MSALVDLDLGQVGGLAKPTTFALTDAGNAEHFASMYGDRLRFDHRRQRWLVWSGHRWVPDANAEVARLALASVRQRLADAVVLNDDNVRKATGKWALSSESRGRLDSLTSIARTLAPIADDGARWDADPWLLGTPSGVIDLRTGKLRAGQPVDRITMATAAPFRPQAACPRWERFQREIFAGDEELMTFVHHAVGYSLTGDTSEQVFFLGHGTGSNGKGTMLNTLREVLGEYAWNMPFSTIELHQRAAIPNDLAALANRRFVIASETNDGSRLNEARVKSLTGCDPITARFLHGEYFEFVPRAKFWLTVNHKPVVRDDSHGFWRRMRLIPFTQTFDLDPTLTEMLKDEHAGILAWAVRGCLAWQAQRLTPPTQVRAATAEYEADSDPLRTFLEEACARDDEASSRASDLYAHYRMWAEREGLSDRERLSSAMFGRKMSERFKRVKTAAGYRYEGIETVRPS